MVSVQVEYTAQLKRAAGVDEESYELPEGARLESLVAAIHRRHGEALRGLLWDGEGQLLPSVVCFIDDHQCRPAEQPALADDQTVTWLSPISGG